MSDAQVTVTEMRLEAMECHWKANGESGYAFLGGTSGPLEMSLSSETVEITSEQTGALKLGEVLTGMNLEVSCTFKELSAANLKLLIGKGVGSYHTPSAGSEVIGQGSGQLFRNLGNDSAGPIRFIPVNGDANSRSLIGHKAYPIPESISFSSENPSELSVTFKFIRDDSMDSSVDLWAWGDVDQDFS
jgi:hypothetical protein